MKTTLGLAAAVYAAGFVVAALIEVTTNYNATIGSVIRTGLSWPLYVRIGIR